jgi:hypothetical protein
MAWDATSQIDSGDRARSRRVLTFPHRALTGTAGPCAARAAVMWSTYGRLGPEIIVNHLDRSRDASHSVDPVWVWDEVQCDFCSGYGVAWSYQVVPLAAVPLMLLNSSGEIFDTAETANETPWTACEQCASLIEAQKWEALVTACANRFKAETGQVLDAHETAAIRNVQHQFVAMRTGARLPYAAG